MNHEQPLVSAILLAAGLSRRMLGNNKLLMTIADRPIWRWSLENVLRSKVDRVFFVAGDDISVSDMPAAQKVTFVHNRRPEAGISSSIKVGVAAAAPNSDGILILLADQPNLQPATINRFVEVFRQRLTKIVATKIGSGIGSPALFPREHFEQLSNLHGDRGAQALLKKHGNLAIRVDIPADELLDVDTLADVENVKQILLAGPEQIP